MGARWISATNSFHTSLVNYSGDISFSVINLFLGGRASPYLYNGTHYHEDKDNAVNVQIQLFKCLSRYRLYKLRVYSFLRDQKNRVLLIMKFPVLL